MYQDFNTKFGDLSAILIENLPYWVEVINTPSRKVSLMGEWESKLKAITAEVKSRGCRKPYRSTKLDDGFAAKITERN